VVIGMQSGQNNAQTVGLCRVPCFNENNLLRALFHYAFQSQQITPFTYALAYNVALVLSTNKEDEDVLYVFVGLHACLHVLRLCVSTHMFVCVCVPRRHEFQQEVKSCQL